MEHLQQTDTAVDYAQHAVQRLEHSVDSVHMRVAIAPTLLTERTQRTVGRALKSNNIQKYTNYTNHKKQQYKTLVITNLFFQICIYDLFRNCWIC